MAPNDSNLTGGGHNYDMVVAITQASLEAGLAQYLQKASGDPAAVSGIVTIMQGGGRHWHSSQVSLSDFVAQYGDPFAIPTGTDYGDPRIQKMNDARLVSAIRTKIGLPPGAWQPVNGQLQLVLPQPIIQLGDDASNVKVALYFSQVDAISNNIGTGFGDSSWNWYSQPQNKAWYLFTETSLVQADLDAGLNTPYFRNHPDEKAAVQARLNNLSNSAFSLQQMLISLDTATGMSPATWTGVNDGEASMLMEGGYSQAWASNAKAYGEPMLGFSVVYQASDPSNLHITSTDKVVSCVIDPNTGEQVRNPTPAQSAVVTLDTLCMVDGHAAPGPQMFPWNWIDPDAVGDADGVMAVSKPILAAYIASAIVAQASDYCVLPSTQVIAQDVVGDVYYKCTLTAGQTPTVTSGDPAAAITLQWKSPTASSSDKDVATYGELEVWSTYTCSVYLDAGASTLRVIQHVQLHCAATWSSTTANAMIVDQTKTTSYTIAVDGKGDLIFTTGSDNVVDHSQGADINWLVNLFTGVKDVVDDMQNAFKTPLSLSLQDVKCNSIRDFVFPGGAVFTFKSAKFSEYGDLVALITYVAPTTNQFSQTSITPTTGTAQPAGNLQLPNVSDLPYYMQPHPGDWQNGWEETFVGSSGGASRAAPTQMRIAKELSEETRAPAKGDRSVKLDPSVKPSLAASTAPANTKFQQSDPAPATTSFSSSSELMLNYVNGNIVNPTTEFRALQINDGHNLLFAADTNKVLNVIQESSGQSTTGWAIQDLSSKFIAQTVPGGAVGHWDVAQSVMDNGTIGLGMAVRSGTSDTLCLCLSNSADDVGWIMAPNWRTFPFDATHGPSSVQIAGIYFAETQYNLQYIIVDVLSDPSSSENLITRYVVNPAVSNGPCWTLHDLPFSIQQGTYQSCIGRKQGEMVDGIYTSGSVAGVGQLQYVPLVNPFGTTVPPLPTRLAVPGGSPLTAISSARFDTQDSAAWLSDLYAVSGETLYRWGYDQQDVKDSPGFAIMTDHVLQDTNILIALVRQGNVTVFGKNGSDTIWYTTCSQANLADPGSWAIPVPVLQGAEQMTSLVNRVDGGNAIFTSGNNQIQRLMQSTDGTNLWSSSALTLLSPPTLPSQSFMSYTTLIHTLQGDAPAGILEVELTASNRTPCYVNGLYYVLSQNPITIKTDATGRIDFVQASSDIVGTIIQATAGGQTTKIDPMQNTSTKLRGFSDESTLRSAGVKLNTKAGGTTGPASSTPLLGTNVSQNDVTNACASMTTLSSPYGHLSGTITGTKTANQTAAVLLRPVPDLAAQGFGDDILTACGDVFQLVKSGAATGLNFVEDTANNVWRAVVQWGDKTLTAILNTLESVAAAFATVLQTLEIAVEDLIKYLQFLFDWDNIQTTQQVMHNMAHLYIQDLVANIQTAQTYTDQSIGKLQTQIATLTGIRDWTPLGDSASKSTGTSGTSSFPTSQSAGSQMAASHFRNNSSQMSFLTDLPILDGPQDVLQALDNAFKQEESVLNEAYTKFKALASSFRTLTLGKLLVEIVGIISETVLGSAQVVIDALFNVLKAVTRDIFTILDAKIHIPVVSDILNSIGVPDISFLDAVTWVGAIAYTVIATAVNGQPPFPKGNATCTALIQAANLQAFTAAFQNTTSANDIQCSSLAASVVSSSASPIPQDVYSAGHFICGLVTIAGAMVQGIEAADTTADAGKARAATICGVATAVLSGGADLVLSKLPIQDPNVKHTSWATTALTVYCKYLFASPTRKALGYLEHMSDQDARQLSAGVNCVLITPALVCTAWHLHELSSDPDSAFRTCAILQETENLLSYIARSLYFLAVDDEDPDSRAVLIGAMMIAQGLNGVADFVDSFVT